MSFLPEGYKVPDSQGQYLKLKQGQNRFRILSSAVVGFVGWSLDKKPIRHTTLEAFNGVAIRQTKEGKREIKHFWAFFVWNFEEKQIQIAEITQKKIMNAVSALVQNDAWGDPKGYNLAVLRSGEGLDTEYVVSPEPPTEMPADAAEAWAKISQKANLKALFTNANPFGEAGDAPTATATAPVTTNDELDIEDIDFGPESA